MQVTSTLYKALLRNPEHLKEVKVAVAGEEYGQDRILSLSTSGGLYASDNPTVGSARAREIDLELLDPGSIPRMAEIRVSVRLVLRDPMTGEITSASEWLPKGVFYIDTRSDDTENGSLTIHGYDAMLKTGQAYLTDGDTREWPRTMDTVAADIAQRIGAPIDARTVVKPYLMGYPNDYTMGEVLGYIAAAHAANWIITDAGKLRMVGLAEIPAETYNLINEEGTAITFGGVRILV